MRGQCVREIIEIHHQVEASLDVAELEAGWFRRKKHPDGQSRHVAGKGCQA